MSHLRLVKGGRKKLERGSVSGWKLIRGGNPWIFEIEVYETVLVIFTVGPAGYTISVYNYYMAGGFTRVFLELDEIISYLDEYCLEGDLYVFQSDTGGYLADVFRDDLVKTLNECYKKVVDSYEVYDGYEDV
jgi:hypothetical protein